MPRAPKRRRYMFEEDLQSQSETQGLLGAQIPEAKKEEATSFPSCCWSASPPSPSSSSCFSSPSSSSPSSSSPSSSCSFSSSFSSSSSSPSSSSSSSSCCTCLVSSYIKVRSAVTGTPRPPQFPQSACFLPNVMAVTPSTQLCQGCSSQEEEGPDTLQALPDTGSLCREAMDERAHDLVGFLLQKYRAKEPTTQVELQSIIREHDDRFPELLRQASQCLQLVFGVDMNELDASEHSYVLVPTLGLTYNGMGSDRRGMPKTGLLIIILSIIVMEGHRVPEEEIWKKISSIGIYAGSEHPIYGEPRELITRIFVQEQYLEYQHTDSDPARYEFLWGPRAHTETNSMKILEFLAKVTNTIPKAFPALHEDALRDEKESSQPRVVVRVNEVANFTTFSCLEYEEKSLF